MNENPEQKTQAIGQILFIFLLFSFGAIFLFFQMHHVSQEAVDRPAVIEKKPIKREATLGVATPNGPYMMYELPLELGRAQIHDIVVDGAVKWLGTDKGLIKIVEDKVTQYQQFSDWPFEWVHHLTVTPHGVFVGVLVSDGNTGGEYAGSHRFDPDTETWTKLGKNKKAQAWLNGALFQIGSTLTKHIADNNWQAEEIQLEICQNQPRTLTMRAIENELWIVGDGRKYPCGATRFNPETGETQAYFNKDGLIHEQGWDVDGDANGVFVTHSVKYNRMSFFNQQTQKWDLFPKTGSGNSMMVTADAVWLATASPRKPLNRVDRNGNSRQLYPPFNNRENMYISALGQEEDKIWFGTYIKHWRDGRYDITSKLGYLLHQP